LIQGLPAWHKRFLFVAHLPFLHVTRAQSVCAVIAVTVIVVALRNANR
jgi:hypothetical protein